MPNTLSDLIKKYITHETESEVKYNQLYSMYSYPNIILPLFGGMLIDKIGINISLIIFMLKYTPLIIKNINKKWNIFI